jgi:UDP-glucose:tetrahydrobiopterin glucosyltransferase
MLKILFLSTPVGFIGSGQGGGVELTVQNICQEMKRRGHKVKVVAPASSILKDIPIQGIPGNVQIAVQTQNPIIQFWQICGNMLALFSQNTIF